MPNWCNNTLTLTHDDPNMIARAKQAFIDGRLLDEFIPVPQELRETTAGAYGDPKEQAKLEAQTAANIKKYGYGNWYDYCVGEWGTKWDIGNGQGIQTWDDHELIVYFDSAWSPPTTAYDKLMDLGFTVYATYYEPGCAFAGIYDEHGDDCYNLESMDSGDVRQCLPQELDETYSISETMEEYEAENEDDVTRWYKDGVEETGLIPHTVDSKKQ
jgi:hypothetical protein